MTVFGPRVGKVKVKHLDGVVGDKTSDKVDGVRANYPRIGQAAAGQPIRRQPIIFRSPFNTQKIMLRKGGGLMDQKSTPAGADFNMNRCRPPEKQRKVHRAAQRSRIHNKSRI